LGGSDLSRFRGRCMLMWFLFVVRNEVYCVPATRFESWFKRVRCLQWMLVHSEVDVCLQLILNPDLAGEFVACSECFFGMRLTCAHNFSWGLIWQVGSLPLVDACSEWGWHVPTTQFESWVGNTFNVLIRVIWKGVSYTPATCLGKLVHCF